MAEPTAPESSPIAEISHGPSAFESFLDKNQKKLIIIGILIALGLGAWVIKDGIREGDYLTAGNALVAADDIDSLKAVTENHSGTPSAASAAVLLSDAQWEQGQQDDALATLEAQIAAHPEHPATAPARARLAARLNSQGKTAEAKAAFQSILDQPDASYYAPYALISLGQIAKAEGDKDTAKELFTQARERYPDNRLSDNAAKAQQFLDFQMPEEVDPPEPPAGANGVDQTPFDPTALSGKPTTPFQMGGGSPAVSPDDLPTPPVIVPPTPVVPPTESPIDESNEEPNDEKESSPESDK